MPSIPISLFKTGIIDPSLNNILDIAIQRKLPAICANQDYTAIQSNNALYMPGLISKSYQDKGGHVISFGKPNVEFFEEAKILTNQLLSKSTIVQNSSSKKIRLLHIGDSLHHDIHGAFSSSIDSILITKHGVHKADLYPAADALHGTFQSSQRVYDVVASEDCSPMKNLEQLQSIQKILKNVCDLCDKESVNRPDFILEELKW